MKFLVDESADARLATHLKSLGHDATTVARDYMPGLEDTEVLAIAQREGRILIANDRDFGELIHRLNLPHEGVIFFRLDTTKLEVKIERLNHVLTEYADQLHAFLVVTEKRVRVSHPRQGEIPETLKTP